MEANMADPRKADRALDPITLQWYLDFISGELQVCSRIEVEQTHDQVLNAVLDDLRQNSLLECADVYRESLGVAKRIYLARFPAPEAEPDPDETDEWFAGVG